MERLTFEGRFCDIAKCTFVPGGSFCESGHCSQRKVWERLKAYEDTGLTPEGIKALQADYTELSNRMYGPLHHKIAEWVKADEAGRLVVLPEGVTIRELQDEYCKAKYMAEEKLPSASYTTGRISGFGAGVVYGIVHILDKILIGEEAEKAMRKEPEK